MLIACCRQCYVERSDYILVGCSVCLSVCWLVYILRISERSKEHIILLRDHSNVKQKHFFYFFSIMVRCCGPKCGSASFKNIPAGLSFHKFPKDERLCNAWIKNMKLVDWKPYPEAVLCSRHFEECMFDRSSHRIRLRPDAIPTIFPELPVPYTTVTNNNRNGNTNSDAERVLVLKPIVCDSSDDSSDDSKNDRNNSSTIQDKSIYDSDSSYDRVDLSKIRNDSSNVRDNSSNTRNDSSNAIDVSSSDSGDDSDSEMDSYCEPAIEVVTLKNTMIKHTVRDIGVQTKRCKVNVTNLKKKIKALQMQVMRRDNTIMKLRQILHNMKSESCNKEKNVINLICVDDMDAYL